MFALRHIRTKRLVGFNTQSNGDEEFCVPVQFELDTSSDSVWVTRERDIAEKVSVSTEEWYSAGFSSPKNPYKGMLEVVELTEKSI